MYSFFMEITSVIFYIVMKRFLFIQSVVFLVVTAFSAIALANVSFMLNVCQVGQK